MVKVNILNSEWIYKDKFPKMIQTPLKLSCQMTA